jgi:hypothetical protein
MTTSNNNDASTPNNEIEKIVVEILKTLHEFAKKKLDLGRFPQGEQTFTFNDRLILKELRLKFDRELQNRKNIENKAGGLIIVSGAIIAILFGFTTVFFGAVRNNVSIYPYLLTSSELFLIIAGATSITLAIVFSSLALRLGLNLSMVSHLNKFILQDGNINPAEINIHRALPTPVIMQNYIASYVNSIKANIDFVNRKAKLIEKAQVLFIIGIIFTGITFALSYLRQ